MSSRAVDTAMVMIIALPVNALGSALSYYLTRMPIASQNYREVHEKPYWITRCPYDKGGRTWDDLGINGAGRLPQLGLVDFSGVILFLLVCTALAKMYTKREQTRQFAEVLAESTRVAAGNSLGPDGFLQRELLAVLNHAKDLATHQHRRSIAHGDIRGVRRVNIPDSAYDDVASSLSQEPHQAVAGVARDVTEMEEVLRQELSAVKMAVTNTAEPTQRGSEESKVAQI